MYRKILCFLLVLFCFNINTFAYFEDVTSEDYIEAVDFLTAVDVISGYDDGLFHPDSNVTRAEFTSMIVRLLQIQLNGTADYTYFSDVEKDYWALSSINAAVEQGLISGYEDGSFRTDSNITVTDAAKIIMCALGYAEIAELSGGYPKGYSQLASQNGILDGVSVAYDEYATRADVAKMLYQALDVNIAGLDLKGNGSAEKYTITDKTLLSDVLKLSKRTGVITSTKYADTINGNPLKENEITVDSVVYKINDSFLHELVGYKITFYTKELEDDEYEIVYYTLNEKNNRSVLAYEEQICYDKITLDKFVYYDEDGRMRNLKIAADYVTVNGDSVKFSDKSVFDIEDGNVLLIDTDGNNVYDRIFVNSAEIIVADRINKIDCTISDKVYVNKTIDLNDEDEDKTVVIRYNNEEVGFADIAINDVLTVYQSNNGQRIVVYISRQTAEGSIESVDENDWVLRLDGSEYVMTKKCIEDLQNNADKKNALLGKQVKLYIDCYGKVALIELMTDDDEKYAFLVKGNVREDDVLALTMWPEDGDVQVFEASEKFKINDGVTKEKYAPSAAIEKLKNTRIVTSNRYVAEPLFQLVKYKLDSEGKVKEIKVARISNDGKPIRKEGIFSRDFLAQSFKTDKVDVINGAYKFASDVKIFNIPPESDNYRKYQRNASFTKSVTANLALYDMNEHNIVQAVLIVNPDYDSYNDTSEYTPFFVVDRVVQVLNYDDELAYRAYGVYNRGEKSYDFSSEPNLVKGDVCQLMLVNDEAVKVNKIYDANKNAFALSTPDANGYGMMGAVGDEVVLAYMYVRDITDSTIVVTNGTTELLLNITTATRCSVYDKENNIVRVGDPSEICEGDKVAIRTFNATAGDITVIR